jgi:predicted phage terminase large subunit-like protein
LPTQGENGSSKPHFDSLIQSWDMAFKDKLGGSFVVGQVWGSKGADRFLMDQDRRQIDFSATLEAVRNLTKRWPDALQKLVEDKANGPAVISALRHEIGGIVEVEPQGGKEARAQAVLPAIESGNVYLPHPAIAPWVNDYIEEWAAAPHGDYWDQIDSTSQALIRLQQRKVFFFT